MSTSRCLWAAAMAASLSMGFAVAKPAPWFWWASKHDGQRVCAQVMPSQGWVKAEGPFTNAQCRSGHGLR